ncbi:MAG: hypothetical protein QXR45_10840 [Candidatus Bathyarchaeia archaeon]|nr:hypothetical protein [Candidatus Bathyarchaeota archaeon]
MEQAVYITKTSELAKLASISYQFSRLYFGNEFCERLIPRLEDLREILDFVSKSKLHFTFVTPYVTNEGLRNLEKLLDYIIRRKPGCEVVFNDYGVLRVLLNRYRDGLKPVMGRLLNKMKRGPRLMNLIDILPETTIKYFKGASIDTQVFQDFLLKNRINRVELDNLLQGIELNLKNGISASLYIPYGYVTTTRACLAINCDVLGKEDEIGVFPCNKECQKYVFYIRSKAMPTVLIRKGNTIFFRNDKIPENLEKIGVDRMVLEPNIPL